MRHTFVIAWHFLTAIPLSRTHHHPTPSQLAVSLRWYPIVGLILGGMLACVDRLLAPAVPRNVIDALLIVLLVLLTRALHQDGLADTLDGMAGGRTPTERLTIMRDGRIGAIGATGLILSLGVRYAALEALQEPARTVVLLIMPALGRSAMVIGAYGAAYARQEGGLAAPFLSHLSWREPLIVMLALAGPVIVGLGLTPGLVTLLLMVSVARACTVIACRLCGGITGDTLGATNELAEIAFLLFATAGMIA